MCFLFILLIFFASPLYAIDVHIKTVFEGKPLPASKVMVWKKRAIIEKKKPDFELETNSSGIGQIDLERGEYYFFAEKETENLYYFGFLGQNPISVKNKCDVSINLVSYPQDFLKRKSKSGISGKVFFNGKAIGDVGVFAYLDLSSELKGPAYLSTVTNANGEFDLELESGSYYLVFRKKKEENFGPPSPGDFVGFFPVFPLAIDENGYEIKVNLLKIPEKISQNLKEKNILVKGKVLDKNNKPIKGVYVVLYEGYALLGKPDYVSHQTDEQGNFSIYVKRGGNYFVVLRKTLGDTPTLGEDVSSLLELNLNDVDEVKEIEIRTNN